MSEEQFKHAIILKQNTEVLCQLAIDIINYLNDLKIETNLNPGIINLAITGLNLIKPDKIIDTFISRSFKHWDEILDKNEDFLIQRANVLFYDLPVEYVNNFSKLFTMIDEQGEFIVPVESRESIWELLHAMVCNCICHVHKMRNWDPINKKYTSTYFSEISVTTQKNKWKVNNLEN